MAKGLPRSKARGSAQSNPIIKQTVRVRSVPINVDGATGIGWGTAVIGDLPEGNILFLGAVAYMQVQTAAGGIIATFTGSYAIGSAPTADSTLAGAEVDLIPATTLAAATAGVSPRTRGVNATQAMLTNTDNSLEINLNLLIDDASISANGQACTLTGDVFLSYVVLGDN